MKKTGLFPRAIVAAFMVLVIVSILGGQVACAQATESDAVKIAVANKPVWHYFGAALGLGLVVLGAALGIGRFAAAAAEGIARQPAAADRITGAGKLPLFLLEGVAILAEVFVLLIVI